MTNRKPKQETNSVETSWRGLPQLPLEAHAAAAAEEAGRIVL